MTKFIAVHSGKGGVGKSTVAINVAASLLERGARVILVDLNLDTPHIGLYLGLVTPEHHIHQFLLGTKDLRNTVYKHESGLRFIPAASTPEMKHINIHEVFEHLDKAFDFVVIDCPSGFSSLVHDILKQADESIVVTTPTMSAVYDAQKTKELAEKYSHTIAAVLVNNPHNLVGLELDEIKKTLEHSTLYVIPHDTKIPVSQQHGGPLVYLYPHAKSRKIFVDLASHLMHGM